MKLSLIVTVYNEEETIGKFIDSINIQTKLPDEVIFVDGGSKDKTVEIIDKKSKQYQKLKIRLYIKKGNRSVGRNEAIGKASSEIILSSDSGNVLDKNWVKNIANPFSDSSVDVVAGYYKGEAKSLFQKCLVPYVLVMPDQVDETNFLPATRSMAFRKSIWKKVGKFNERLSHNEDYAFSNKLLEKKAKIVFVKDAIVYWLPRKNIIQAFKMFFRFARGDIQADILRNKVILLFTRYILFFYFIFLSFAYRSLLLSIFVLIGTILYIAWSDIKSYKYVNDIKSIFVLPIIQVSADISVILGTVVGFLDKFLILNFKKIIKSNMLMVILIFVYILIELSTINWGIPNINHPFVYGMDEWHSLQALRSVVSHGTASIEGAANGPIFFYFLTGLYLIPFFLLGLINPLSIKSSVDNLVLQQRLFEVLRFSTLVYGIFSIILMYILLKKYFPKSVLVGTLFFALSPIFFALSNYFKYDLAVTFWILLSVFLILRYKQNQTLQNLCFAAVACALAISVKISALPLAPIFIASFFLFTDNLGKKLKNLFIATAFFVASFLIFGIPDIFFKSSAYGFLLLENVIRIPQSIMNLDIGLPWWQYILVKFYPSTFGYFTIIMFYISFLFLVLLLFKKIKNKQLPSYKNEIFVLILVVLFAISLIPLKLTGGGSRSLVLSPMIVLTISLFYKRLNNLFPKFKFLFLLILSVGFILQSIQIFSWVYLKWQVDPQQSSSEWIVKNIPKGTTMGIENIPIYQNLPDIVLKEYYFKDYGVKNNYLYNYKIISSKDTNFPNTVIVTNVSSQKYFKSSETKSLVKKLNKIGYDELAKFSLNLEFYEFFNDKAYLIFGNLVQVPTDIVIYQKEITSSKR